MSISAMLFLEYFENHGFLDIMQTLVQKKQKLLRSHFFNFNLKQKICIFQGHLEKSKNKWASIFSKKGWKKARETLKRKLTYVKLIFWSCCCQIWTNVIFPLQFWENTQKKSKKLKIFCFVFIRIFCAFKS